ncbi:hypothetical protein EVAR_27055_1 [Eumeta japonica]|uniref:Uncharacterized protein n=1 Tax=Eumeta variegata TaxID=151549 RepID=A0A4C1WE59_EUMVA|nr:hypothetical protein EVAR_27055_1 [Eumeta japonica]
MSRVKATNWKLQIQRGMPCDRVDRRSEGALPSDRSGDLKGGPSDHHSVVRTTPSIRCELIKCAITPASALVRRLRHVVRFASVNGTERDRPVEVLRARGPPPASPPARPVRRIRPFVLRLANEDVEELYNNYETLAAFKNWGRQQKKLWQA